MGRKEGQDALVVVIALVALYLGHKNGLFNLTELWNSMFGIFGTTTPGTTPPPTGGGSTDASGVTFFHGTGETTVIPQSRDEDTDKRWSQNFADVSGGYEATVYAKLTGPASGAHIGLKHWGPNHKAPCSNEEPCGGFAGPGGQCCCCWYDSGLKEGSPYFEIERPHNDNLGNFCPSGGCPGSAPLDSPNGVGVKWSVFPEGAGVRVKMWIDPDGFPNGTPANNWQPVYDILDTGEILPDYTAPPDQEIEMRISDTTSVETLGGGLLVKMIGASTAARVKAYNTQSFIYNRFAGAY